MPRCRGFTLAELMATLAVLSVLSAIAVPAFSQLVASVRLDSAFHSITGAFASARIAAVTKGMPVTLCPSADGLRCRRDLAWEDGWISFLDPLRKGAPASADDILQRWNPDLHGLAVRSTVGRHYVRYQPIGTTGGVNLTLRICARRPAKKVGEVILNIGGRVYSRRAEAADPCPYEP